MSVTDAFIFSASAKAWRQRQIKVGVLFEGPSNKTWFLKCSEKRTFNWDMSNLSDSKLGKTIQTSTVSVRSFSNIQHPHICWQLNSIKDEWWNYSTSKPSKLLSVKGCRKHDIMTCRSIQRFCGAHHTPGLHTLVANLVVGQIDVCDWRIYLQCLG